MSNKYIREKNRDCQRILEKIDKNFKFNEEEVDKDFYSFSEREQPLIHPNDHVSFGTIWTDEIEEFIEN